MNGVFSGGGAINWEAIGAIGEILGAAAVVVSLVYLATQIRTQNRESRVASVHEIISAHRNFLSELNDHSTAQILTKAASGFDDLTEVERLRYIQICMNMFKLNEEAYYQLRPDRLEDYI